MDSLSSFAHGFAVAATPDNLLLVLLGVSLGMVIGVLPGIGPTTTIAILLPLTFSMDSAGAVIMLAGIYYGAMYGGTITSVLVKVPGEIASVVTTFDGYQMARQGRAGSALGVAAIGSFVGGVGAMLGLVLLAQPLARFAERFGAPELFMVAVAGLFLVLTMSGGSMVRSTAMLAVGLIIAVVGQDPVTGEARLTFGSLDALGGIELVAVAMGLFGISEVLCNVAKGAGDKPLATRIEGMWPSRSDLRASAGPIARGTGIGSVIGLIPGGGSVLAAMASYAAERRLARDPDRFGKGAIEGVAGPETANNAGSTMSFLPLLTLGLPTGTVMALIFGALLLQGITPGPTLVSDHPDVFWGVMASMLIGNVILLVLNFPLIGLFVQLLRVRLSVISVVTAVVTVVGVYSLNGSLFDVAVCLVSGVVGFIMRRCGLPPGPLILAAVLGSLLELNLRNSLAIADGDLTVFATRPISLTLLVLVLLGCAGSAWQGIRARRPRGSALHLSTGHADGAAGDDPGNATASSDRPSKSGSL